ncbi:MAG TPA: cupin domain-containing protein [Acetobacteraceae bacterium]|nr:cupin domain-containing protein [Acetobacteraceae bacterium]
MDGSTLRTRRGLGETVLLAAIVMLTGSAIAADSQNVGAAIKPVLSQELANVPGKNLTAVVVTYGPGGKSPRHHHAGSVFAYVLSGSIRSQVSGQGPARVYKTGEAFFEPPGSEHLVSENASVAEPASLLAVFVSDTGAQLTVLDH